ncbi:MAG: hypothetical protein DMG65_05070 [Candidatus Angelobacter sp. Gp1-AA117]|nr:MAG: hypothetical protein DMG65_05070 [Candidatus Angelobacter sp. Gp1-AA117]
MQLSQAYEKGNGVKQDYQSAFEWCRKAAEQGNAEAQNALGVMYSLGRGVAQSKEEAFLWYKKAAKQNIAKADYNVAISYYNGDGVGSDLATAYAWMMLAQRNGDPDAEQAMSRIRSEFQDNDMEPAKLLLADMYDKGDDVQADFASSIALYRELAGTETKVNDGTTASEAQYMLCQHYFVGRGVPQDYPKAKLWCKAAAGNYKYFAFVVLARMAEQGLGGPKDPQEAEIWYRDAALMDVADAVLYLGKLKSQSGNHNDEKEAYFWLSLARQMQINEADAPLQQVSAHLTPREMESERKKVKKWNKTDSDKRWKQVMFP